MHRIRRWLNNEDRRATCSSRRLTSLSSSRQPPPRLMPVDHETSPFHELVLEELWTGVGRTRVRQHVNPLRGEYREPTPPPKVLGNLLAFGQLVEFSYPLLRIGEKSMLTRRCLWLSISGQAQGVSHCLLSSGTRTRWLWMRLQSSTSLAWKLGSLWWREPENGLNAWVTRGTSITWAVTHRFP